MKYDYLELGKIIKEKREDYELSTRELAEKVGMSHSEISRLENGLKANIGVYSLAKICDVLDINIKFLLEDVGLYEEKEERLFYIIFKNKNLNCFKLHAKNEYEAMAKGLDFVMENELIELDKKISNVEVLVTEDEENLPTSLEEFDDRIEENIKENMIEDEGESSSESECETCKYYCPYCGECTFGE